DDVGGGGEEVVEVLGPGDRVRHPRRALARDASVEHMGELDEVGELRAFGQDSRDRRANGAESEQPDAECARRGIPQRGTRCAWMRIDDRVHWYSGPAPSRRVRLTPDAT